MPDDDHNPKGLKLIRGNSKATRDGMLKHKQRMLQSACPHDVIVIHNKTGIKCNYCGILCSLVLERDPDNPGSRNLTVWIGELQERKNDEKDPA